MVIQHARLINIIYAYSKMSTFTSAGGDSAVRAYLPMTKCIISQMYSKNMVLRMSRQTSRAFYSTFCRRRLRFRWHRARPSSRAG